VCCACANGALRNTLQVSIRTPGTPHRWELFADELNLQVCYVSRHARNISRDLL
jgi:hypothetical protein